MPPGAGVWCNLGAGIRSSSAGIRRGGGGKCRRGAGIKRLGYPPRRIPALPLHIAAPPMRISAPTLHVFASSWRQIPALGGAILEHLTACLELSDSPKKEQKMPLICIFYELYSQRQCVFHRKITL